MRLAYFEIRKIGQMFRNMTPQFARCDVSIGIRDDTKEAINDIRLDLVIDYREEDSIGTVKKKILEEALRVLQEAVRNISGNDIQSLYAAADDDEKIQEEMRTRSFKLSS